jgi:acid phosphatase (class A)
MQMKLANPKLMEYPIDMTRTLMILVSITILFAVGVYALSNVRTAETETVIQDADAKTALADELDLLTFSNTQTYGEEFLAAANSDDPFLKKALPLISITPPPSNSSETTAEEIAFLNKLEDERTQEMVDEIIREMDINTTVFGTTTIEQFASEEIRPHTNKLIHLTLEKSGTVIQSIKRSIDRVRPHFIDPTLKPAIDVPNHPAYPSGHATQSRLLALLFSELDPENRELYIDSSSRIAHNREIAGVHYPSDSAFGQDLAAQLLPLLFEDDEFLELYALAETEW